MYFGFRTSIEHEIYNLPTTKSDEDGSNISNFSQSKSTSWKKQLVTDIQMSENSGNIYHENFRLQIKLMPKLHVIEWLQFA